MTSTLRLTRPFMHGPAVVRLQEWGDMLGFDGGSNDGIYGPDTVEVVEDIQEYLGLRVDGVCGPTTWRAIGQAVDMLIHMPIKIAAVEESGVIIYNRAGLHPRPKLFKKERSKKIITGITLHQTGTNFGPREPHGWDRLNAHIVITRQGQVIIENDFTDWIWHAQGLSRFTIGLEFEGNFPGLIGDERTLWKGGGAACSLTPWQVMAAEVVFNKIIVPSNLPIKNIYAHRQSSKTRHGDPGEQIWKTIAAPWRERIECPKTDLSMSWGSGRSIPDAWEEGDPLGKRGYWDE